MFDQIPGAVWICLAAYCVACVVAGLKGERDERIVAATLVVAACATPFLKDRHWPSVQWAIFTDDLMVFAVLLWRALRTERWWPLAATAFQLLILCVHGATIIDRSVSGWTSITATILLSYGLLGALLAGAWSAFRRRQSMRRRFKNLVRARGPRARPSRQTLAAA